MKRSLLIKFRKAKKLSRIKLAELLFVSESTIEKVENGIRRTSPSLAQRWAKELEIGIDHIWAVFFEDQQDKMSGCGDDIPLINPRKSA